MVSGAPPGTKIKVVMSRVVFSGHLIHVQDPHPTKRSPDLKSMFLLFFFAAQARIHRSLRALQPRNPQTSDRLKRACKEVPDNTPNVKKHSEMDLWRYVF